MAFNAMFERVCLSKWLNLADYLDPASWKCSMIWSAYMGLPLSLEGVGAVLGLEKQKLTEGKSLEANIQLVYNNVKLGAQIASELCKL